MCDSSVSILMVSVSYRDGLIPNFIVGHNKKNLHITVRLLGDYQFMQNYFMANYLCIMLKLIATLNKNDILS